MTKPSLFVASLLVLLSARAPALDGFPPSVQLPAEVTSRSVHQLNHDQLELLVGKAKVRKQGKLTTAALDLHYPGKRPTALATWQAWAPLLIKGGWRVVGESGAEIHTLSRKEGGVESLLAVTLGDFDEPAIALLETGGHWTRLEFPPPHPAPGIEKVPAQQDWPWLPAFPGAKLTATAPLPEQAFTVRLPGAEESTVVSNGTTRKEYLPPPTLSAYETALSMRDGLTRAGWEVLPAQDPDNPEGNLIAHYHRNGRDIWAQIVRAADDSSQGLTYTVADVGADDWAKELKKNCRLTLTGVNFDFNKWTLRAGSAAALEKAAAALQAAPGLAVEVQGHTDNVGDDATNAALSTRRAEAVVAWLAAHGIEAARLTAQGYGKEKPVAGNDTDAGRAQNRRVEVVCRR